MIIAGITRTAVSIAVALAMAAAPSMAKRHGKKDKKTVAALFISARDAPSPELYAAFLGEVIVQGSPARVLYGKTLRKLIKTKPEKVISKCDSDIHCIARLSQKARADVAIYGQVSPDGDGIKVQLLVIDVAAQSITERLALTLASTAEIQREVAAHLDTLYPDSSATPAETEEIPLDVVLGDVASAQEAAPSASAGEPAPSDSGELPLDFALDPEPATSGWVAASQLLAAAKGGEPRPVELDVNAAVEPDLADEPLLKLLPAPKEAEPRPEESEEMEGVDPDLGVQTTMEPLSVGGRSLLAYVGIGIVALGAVTAGAGGYFGLEATSTRNSIQYGTGGTTQLDAERLGKDANDEAALANLLFAAGGGAVAMGAVLIALDLWAFDDSALHASGVIGGDGAVAALTWHF